MGGQELVEEASKSLFSNGVLGIAVVGLVYFVMMLRAELKDVRTAHRVEMAEKDKHIVDLYDRLVVSTGVGTDLARSTNTTLQAFLPILRNSAE